MKDSYYPYVGEVEDEVVEEIMGMAQSAIQAFGVPYTEEGREIATCINGIVDNILETHEIPDCYESIDEVAMVLGCLYGFALGMEYGWEWKRVGQNEEDNMICMVSPDDNWFNPCAVYICNILNGHNTGLDGNNDNTCLLLFNMIENAIKSEPEKKLTPLV